MRNRIRRRGYSALAKLLPDVKKGFLGHFNAKKGLETRDFEDIFSEVRELLQRAGALGYSVV